MFRQVQLLYSSSCLVTRRPRVGCKNFATSKSLFQSTSKCEKPCPPPEPQPARKVAIIGAGSDVGQMVSLFLKQQNVIKTLALYDDVPERHVLGVASDLAHIDTSTEIEAYQGWAFIKNALYNADVVLICGGHGGCCERDHDVFLKNVRLVRTTAVAIAQFCPRAVVAVQTPPVDCNYALCAHTLKERGVYDRRRVLGVNAVSTMRANQLYCSLMGTDPTTSNIAVVGGCCRCTRVPVFSGAKPNPFDCCVSKTQLENLTSIVRDADDIISSVKPDMKQGHLSIGFSTARFVLNIMKGLFESPAFLDSALVEQSDPEKCYGMRVCSTPVMVGRRGVEQCSIPELNEVEQALLESSNLVNQLETLPMKWNNRQRECLIQELQKELEKLKATCIINTEKIGYNYQVLKKREEENVFVRSQQKRKINKMSDVANKLRAKIRKAPEDGVIEEIKADKEIVKLMQAMDDLEKKSYQFSHVNFSQIWRIDYY